jgi:hypothetical protein
VEIMNTCIRRGPAASNLGAAARTRPGPLLAVGVALSAGARQWPCAIAAFEALLALDTAATVDADARRWYALVGLQGLRLSRGDTAGADRAITDFLNRWKAGTSLYLFDAATLGSFREKAAAVAVEDAREYKSDFTACSTSLRCWLLGIYLTSVGRVGEGAAIAPRLFNPTGRAATAEDSVLGRSLIGHTQLARGDTSAAVATFQRLLLSGRSISGLEWDLAMPLAAERLALARIMIARGQPDSAIAVLDVYDSRSVVHAGFAATSLHLRSQAAMQLRDDTRASTYRARWLALQQK